MIKSKFNKLLNEILFLEKENNIKSGLSHKKLEKIILKIEDNGLEIKKLDKKLCVSFTLNHINKKTKFKIVISGILNNRGKIDDYRVYLANFRENNLFLKIDNLDELTELEIKLLKEKFKTKNNQIKI